jgi:hypothetical protein
VTLRHLGRGISFADMSVGMLFVAFAVLAALMPAQNDTFWHLRAGADIWRTGEVPRVDHYSHTFAGAPWPDHEWLAQALMFATYRLGGMPGLELAAALLVLAAVALTWRLMVGPPATRAVVMTMGLVLGSAGWVLRPHVLSLLLLAVLTWLLVRERFRIIPLLFALWANAHGGVVLGGLALAAAAAAAGLRWWVRRDPADRRRAVTLALVVPLSALACAASPLGFGIYHFVIESTARSFAVRITEWFPVWPTDGFGVLFWCAALALLALVIGRRRALASGHASAWADWVPIAIALALLPFAIRSFRNTPPFVLVATLAANRLLGNDFRFGTLLARLRRGPPRPATPDHPRLNLALLAGVATAAIVAVAAVFASGGERLGWRPIGDGALAATRACDGPLYNRYDDGGLLIWFVPEKPVFVDGRQDPYPLRFLADVVAVESAAASHRPLFEAWRIRCAFLPADSHIAVELGKQGWQRRFADDRWIVLAAPPSR